MLTRQQLTENITAMEAQGAPPGDIQAYLDSQKQQGSGIIDSTKQFIGEVAGSAKKRFDNAFTETEQLRTSGDTSRGAFAETALRVGGQVAGFANDTIFSGIKAGAKTLLPGSAERKLSSVAKSMIETPAGQEAIAALGKGMDAYNSWKANNQDAAKNLEAVVNIGSLALQLKGLATVGKGVNKLTSATSKSLGKASAAVNRGVSSVQTAGSNMLGSKALEAPKAFAEGAGRTVQNIANRGKEAVTGAFEKSARLKSLPVAEAKAIRAGIDENVAKFIKTSAADDIDDYIRMVDLQKASVNPALRSAHQAKEVVGQTILRKAVAPVLAQKKEAGKALGAVVDSLPKGRVSLKGQLDDFVRELERVGVTVGSKGRLVAGRGAVSGDLSGYQNLFNRIVDVSDNGALSAAKLSLKEIHAIRSATFKEFGLAAKRLQPFSSQADDVAERFRQILSKPIANIRPEYLTDSMKFAKAHQALEGFVKWTTYKGNLDDITLQNLRVSEVAQRLLGHASARPEGVLDDILKLAGEAGPKVKQSIMDQIRFSDLLDDLYGSTQTRSLAGGVARGTAATAERVAEDVVTGGVIRASLNAAKGFFGGTPKETQKAFEEFLRSLSKAPKSIFKGKSALVEPY